MKRIALLVVLLSLLITRPIVGQQQSAPANPALASDDWHSPDLAARALKVFGIPVDPDKGEVQIHKLSSNLYMLQFVAADGGRGNFGGNVVASVGDDGIVLVDAGYAPMAPKLAAALKTLSDKPVKYILHTHWHIDHAEADGYFAPAVVIGQDTVRTRMQTGSKRFPPLPATSYPSITFSDQITLHINGGEIHGIHFPAAHTNTDTVYFYPAANVVQMGDVFTNGNAPGLPGFDMDTDGSGGPQGVIAAWEYVLAHSNADTKIIPGHGNMAATATMVPLLAFLKAATAAVQAGIDQGKSLDQLKQEKVLASVDNLGMDPMREDAAIQRLYTNLTLRRTITQSGGAR